jgi:hypothetical protein
VLLVEDVSLSDSCTICAILNDAKQDTWYE